MDQHYVPGDENEALDTDTSETQLLALKLRTPPKSPKLSNQSVYRPHTIHYNAYQLSIWTSYNACSDDP